MEDRRDLDPASPARRPATAATVPPGRELGGPGTARDPARRDTEGAAPGNAAAGDPDTILRWHRDIIRRWWGARSMRGKTGRPATRRNIKALALRLGCRRPAGIGQQARLQIEWLSTVRPIPSVAVWGAQRCSIPTRTPATRPRLGAHPAHRREAAARDCVITATASGSPVGSAHGFATADHITAVGAVAEVPAQVLHQPVEQRRKVDRVPRRSLIVVTDRASASRPGSRSRSSRRA